MIELLVVMFIMAVVVALIVGVSKYVMDGAAKKQTETAQEIVLQAIQEYRRVKNAVPPDSGGEYKTDVLMEALEECEQSAKIVEKLSKEVYPQRRGELRDGYDKPMRYYQDEAIGNEPLLLSAGPDRKWGQSQPSEREDNIASDGSTVNP